MVTMILKDELDKLAHDYSILVNLKPGSEFEFYKVFESIRNHSVLVSIARPASNVHSILKRHGINLDDIHIIDAISNEIDAEKVNNATYLRSAGNLSDMSLAIENSLRLLPSARKTLVFDSIWKLSQFHDSDELVGFIKFLNTRLKDMNTQAIFLSSDKINHINNRVMHLMDKNYSF